MISNCIFWLLVISFIIFCEGASLRKEGVAASYFSAGRWRPGRPLKRSSLLSQGSSKAEAIEVLPQAAPSGVADNLGPQIIDESDLNNQSGDLSSIVDLSGTGAGDFQPMMLADGFGSRFLSPLDGQELNPIDESVLFLMLNSGENYITKNPASKPLPSQIPATSPIKEAQHPRSQL